MDSQYIGSVTPYNSAGSFIDFVAGLTYDHVNFIFSGSSPMQDSGYSPVNMGNYKFGYSESGATQYYSADIQSYEVYDHTVVDEYSRRVSEFSSNDQTPVTSQHDSERDRMSNTNVNTSHRDCPASHHSSDDYQAIWHEYIDPDNMSYEELLELGETVGTQNRGLSPEQISLLPVSKFRSCLLLRKKSRSERCVICQMEYKRGDRLMTLPCKHKYHASCGTKWLTINKACPICYTDVVVGTTKKS